MARRADPKVRMWVINFRPDGRGQPYTVRWTVEGNPKPFAESFSSKRPADAYRAQLVRAYSDGERFSPKTGLPVSWATGAAIDVAAYAKLYIETEQSGLNPPQHRTVVSYAEALGLFIEHSAPDRAPKLTSQDRSALRAWLLSDKPLPKTLAQWITRWCPLIEDLDGPALLRIDDKLRRKVDGTPASPATGRRITGVVRCALDRAVTRGYLEANEWPTPDKGTERRKSAKNTETPASVALSVGQIERLLPALVTHQPASHEYRAMVAIMGYAGLRPSEVLGLEVADLTLPADGWGLIKVRRAWSGRDAEMVAPKTGERVVPIHPVLVSEVRSYLDRKKIKSGPLFRTREGNVPSLGNLNRALAKACDRAQVPKITNYDLRHSCATNLHEAGVELSQAAKMMGHELETMLRYYVHTTEDAEAKAMEAIDRSMGMKETK